MAIVFGSMNHTYSGRKKKKLTRGRKTKAVFKELQPKESTVYRRETPHYLSLPMGSGVCGTTKSAVKQEISSKYTIAPAYNKGAYQVISIENVKDIGR